MRSKTSFWQLLNDYTVEIPMIQRDYAQGRRDVRTQQIRKTFLDDLRATLAAPSGDINLDFVYGSAVSRHLILLDGQQRLTTLFLLHWYLAALSPEDAPDTALRLEKFTYETRTTTRDFCNALTNQLLHRGAIVSDDQPLSGWIEDAAWFPRSWKRDPSIVGMLQMLDDIQDHFQGLNSKSLWGRLTSESTPAITFQFLNMEDFRLTDELYIKMNARGKALSDFENFKAWLQLYVERKQFLLAPADWAEAFDSRWTDLFWNHRAPDAEEIDDAYLNFFNGQALCTFAASREMTKGKLDERDSRAIQALNDNAYFGTAEREALGAYTAAALGRCFAVLEALCRFGITAGDYLPWFSQPKNYGERVLAHAVSVFLALPAGYGTIQGTGGIEFSHWIRVAGNLVRNTIIDSPITFVRAVRSVDAMAGTLFPVDGTDGSLYLRIAKLDPQQIDFFSTTQCKEEVHKCQLICAAPVWERLIVKAESHPYFSGQVSFLIDFSSVEGDMDPATFECYWALAATLFAESIRNHGKYLLQRALLSYGDYTADQGLNKNLCRATASVLRDREENWRRVFRDPDRRALLKQLCDDLLVQLEGAVPTIDAVATQLGVIIGEHQSVSTGSDENWRSMLVTGESLLDECAYLQIRRTKDTPGSEYTSTYLLAGLRMSGSHAELNTYGLWLDRLSVQTSQGKFHPFTSGDYHWVSGGSEKPYIFLDGWRFAKCDVTLRIYNHGGQFAIHLLAREDECTLPTTICQKMVTELAFGPAANGFGMMELLVSMSNIDQRLDEITASLGQLIEAAMAPEKSHRVDDAVVSTTLQDSNKHLTLASTDVLCPQQNHVATEHLPVEQTEM